MFTIRGSLQPLTKGIQPTRVNPNFRSEKFPMEGYPRPSERSREGVRDPPPYPFVPVKPYRPKRTIECH